MKRFWMILLALVLCAFCAQAEMDNRAALWRDAPLLSAPLEGATEVMRYYAGTRVEIVREVDSSFVYVNVGTKGGSQMGYMKKSLLVYGEENIRKVYPERKVYPQHGWTLYSYCDSRSEVISRNGDTYIHAMGENDEWAHVVVTSGPEQWTGFVSKQEEGLNGETGKWESQSWIYTTPLENEMKVEDAIAYAKKVILEAGAMANAQQSVPVTMEMLENCRVSVGIQWDIDECYAGALSNRQIEELEISRPQTIPPLCYTVTFFYTDRTWEDGFPMICALACLYVEGSEVVTYDFGKG